MDAQLTNSESRVGELQQSLNTSALEKSYAKALLQIQQIHEEERSRVLRVRIQLLEDDNDTLQDQLAEADENLEVLERTEEEMRDQLAEGDIEVQRVQNELRIKTREIDTLKAELNSLNSVSVDSTKLLTEKLALSRELATLKPELEHLRSQLSSHQSALSEKLALQRQLSSVQVELETERRALERAKTKDTKQAGQDAKLKIQLDELKKELAKEKPERQKKDKQVAKEAAEWEVQRTVLDSKLEAFKQSDQDGKLKSQIDDLKKELTKEKSERQKKDKQVAKEVAEWEAQRTILESKLEAFRTKLRTTKDQLKETQEELQKTQAAAAERRTTINPRKRSIARFDPDATIGTPGDGHAAKRNKRASSALPGDKSTFSITPFLNRTLSIAPDSPEEPEAAAIEEDVEDKQPEKSGTAPTILVEPPEQDPSFPVISRAPAKPQVKKAGALQVVAQKANPRSKARKPSSLSVLEKVTEEGNEENEDAEPADEPQESTTAQIAQPKKKHKLLGSNQRTLFDDDDAEAPKDARKILFGGPIGGLNKRGGRALSIPRGSLRVGFGPAEFSPLKKDRRSAAS